MANNTNKPVNDATQHYDNYSDLTHSINVLQSHVADLMAHCDYLKQTRDVKRINELSSEVEKFVFQLKRNYKNSITNGTDK